MNLENIKSEKLKMKKFKSLRNTKNNPKKLEKNIDVLEKTLEFLSKNGTQVEGIFRVSGNQAEIKQLKKKMIKGKKFIKVFFVLNLLLN